MQRPDSPNKAHPIAYATAATDSKTPADTRFFAAMSLLVGAASIVICGTIIASAIRNARGNWTDPHAQYEEALHGIVVFGFFLFLAVLLIAGAAMLWRSDPRGLTLHWLYVWLQLATSIVFAFETKSDFDHGPAGAFSIFVAITAGAITAAYPIMIVLILPRLSKCQAKTPLGSPEGSISPDIATLADGTPPFSDSNLIAEDVTTIDWIEEQMRGGAGAGKPRE